MPAPRHLGIFNNTTFPEPASLFDDYEGRGRAAREQDMSIEHTLTNDWDLKLLTREEMLKDTTNRLTAYTSACLPPYRTNGTPYMRSALPNTAKAT